MRSKATWQGMWPGSKFRVSSLVGLVMLGIVLDREKGDGDVVLLMECVW